MLILLLYPRSYWLIGGVGAGRGFRFRKGTDWDEAHFSKRWAHQNLSSTSYFVLQDGNVKGGVILKEGGLPIKLIKMLKIR
jgi:hypothetical protein